MRHLYLPDPVGERSEMELSGRSYRYLSRVLRLRAGDSFDAVDAAGARCVASILSVGRDSVRVKVMPVPMEEGEPAGLRLSLYQCLPKGRKMDIIIRQATEAGVCAIRPVRSARCVPEPAEGRVERWRRISIEALQQCGRREPPAILPEVDLRDLPPEEGAASVFFHEDPAGAEPLHRLLEGPVERVRVLIGPEGGLDPQEVRLLAAAGWRRAWLGPSVLRVETAAAVAVGAVSLLYLEREAWRAQR